MEADIVCETLKFYSCW